MSTISDIDQFLAEFKVKLGIWGIVYRDDRGKNTQTLLDLEIRSMDREKVLKDLKSEDYSEGPVHEKLYRGSDMWIFGKTIIYKDYNGSTWCTGYLYFISCC